MSKRDEFLDFLSDKQNLRELFITRFTANIHRWDGLVNDTFSSEEDFEECLAKWYKIKRECERHFTPREVDEMIDAALRRVTRETLQGVTCNETTY